MSDKDVLLTLMLSNALSADDNELPESRAKRIKKCAEELLFKAKSDAIKNICLDLLAEKDPVAVCVEIERSTANFFNK